MYDVGMCYLKYSKLNVRWDEHSSLDDSTHK